MEFKLTQERVKMFRRIFWDYNFEASRLMDILSEKDQGNTWFNRESVLIRMFERLSWYELLEIFGEKEIITILSDPFIQRLRHPALKRKYEVIRQILQGKTLSVSGWDNAHRKRLQNTILSHRWDRA